MNVPQFGAAPIRAIHDADKVLFEPRMPYITGEPLEMLVRRRLGEMGALIRFSSSSTPGARRSFMTSLGSVPKTLSVRADHDLSSHIAWSPPVNRYDLTDLDWSVIEPLLPNKSRGVPRVHDRRVLNGTMLRSGGAPWRGASPVWR